MDRAQGSIENTGRFVLSWTLSIGNYRIWNHRWGKGDMMNHIPKDPVMLLSYVNTQLRDFYPSLEEFCRSADVPQEQIERTLKSIEYKYDLEKNQFV